MSKIINLLEQKNIPALLYGIFNTPGQTVTIDQFMKSLVEKNCTGIDNIIGQKIGQGAVNEVYEFKGYVIRKTKTQFDIKSLNLIETEEVEQTPTGNFDKKTKYILSDQLYDIVITSIISRNYGNMPNFDKYIGSFYCQDTKNLYSIIEKNDISLLTYFYKPDAILSKSFLFNILFQYACICHLLSNIGIVDFDRHLDNVMIKYKSYVGDKSIYNNVPYYDYKINSRTYRLENDHIFVIPIDFGISYYKGSQYYIYNEPKQYQVSHTKCTSSFTQLENIKAVYALQNKEIHQNVMFFFFLKNMFKVLNIVSSTNTNYSKDIKDFILIVKNLFNDYPCKGLNILEDRESPDHLDQGFSFYLYRNIGLPDVKMYKIIEALYQTIQKHLSPTFLIKM